MDSSGRGHLGKPGILQGAFRGTVLINGARLIMDGKITFDGTELIAREEWAQPPILRLSGTQHRFSPDRYVRVESGIILSEKVSTYAGA